MDYDTVAGFSALWGLIYFVILFAGVLVYALWPGNQKTFDHASRMPLTEEERHD